MLKKQNVMLWIYVKDLIDAKLIWLLQSVSHEGAAEITCLNFCLQRQTSLTKMTIIIQKFSCDFVLLAMEETREVPQVY